jgi:hypothetical protein
MAPFVPRPPKMACGSGSEKFGNSHITKKPMWPYIIVGVSVALVTMLIVYIEGKLTDRKRSKVQYLEIVSLTIFTTLLFLFVVSWMSPDSSVKSVMHGGSSPFVGDVVMLPEIGEEMLTGRCPF